LFPDAAPRALFSGAGEERKEKGLVVYCRRKLMRANRMLVPAFVALGIAVFFLMQTTPRYPSSIGTADSTVVEPADASPLSIVVDVEYRTGDDVRQHPPKQKLEVEITKSRALGRNE
jgi:hypothetical protein